jgi:hypothetical protein
VSACSQLSIALEQLAIKGSTHWTLRTDERISLRNHNIEYQMTIRRRYYHFSGDLDVANFEVVVLDKGQRGFTEAS